jgi:hypothetical protein
MAETMPDKTLQGLKEINHKVWNNQQSFLKDLSVLKVMLGDVLINVQPGKCIGYFLCYHKGILGPKENKDPFWLSWFMEPQKIFNSINQNIVTL